MPRRIIAQSLRSLQGDRADNQRRHSLGDTGPKVITRYLAGVSQERPDYKPSTEEQQLIAEGLRGRLISLPGVRHVKVADTIGLFQNVPEASFDSQVSVDRGFDPKAILEEVFGIARRRDQQDAAFVSRMFPLLRANERFRLEVRFRQPLTVQQAQPVVDLIRGECFDGFTFDTIGSPGKFQGVRIQYIPEFSGPMGPEVDGKLNALRLALVEHKAVAKASVKRVRYTSSVSR